MLSEVKFSTFCLTGFSHRRLGVFGSPVFHRQYHSPLKEMCSELQFLPGKKVTLITELNYLCVWTAWHAGQCLMFSCFLPVCMFSVGPESGFQDTQKAQTNGVWLWRPGGWVWALHTSLHEGQHVTKVQQWNIVCYETISGTFLWLYMCDLNWK